MCNCNNINQTVTKRFQPAELEKAGTNLQASKTQCYIATILLVVGIILTLLVPPAYVFMLIVATAIIGLYASYSFAKFLKTKIHTENIVKDMNSSSLESTSKQNERTITNLSRMEGEEGSKSKNIELQMLKRPKKTREEGEEETNV